METMARVFASRRRYEAAQRTARVTARAVTRDGLVRPQLPGPLGAWLSSRDLPAPAAQSFREWWRAQPDQSDPDGHGGAA